MISVFTTKTFIIENKKSKDQKEQVRPERYTHYNTKDLFETPSSNGLKCNIWGKEDHVPTASCREETD